MTNSIEIELSIEEKSLVCYALRAVFEAGRTPHESRAISAAQQVAGAAAKMLRDLLNNPGQGAALGLAWTAVNPWGGTSAKDVAGVLVVAEPTLFVLLLNAGVQALAALSPAEVRGLAVEAAKDWVDQHASEQAYQEGIAEEIAKIDRKNSAAIALLMSLQGLL